MKNKKKAAKIKKTAKVPSNKSKLVVKDGYYDKFDEKAYAGPEVDVSVVIKRKNKLLKHLEKDVVKQNEEEVTLEHLDDEEESLSEDPRSSEEGLGIEEAEAKGEEAYPEIAEAEKDPDEEEEE